MAPPEAIIFIIGNHMIIEKLPFYRTDIMPRVQLKIIIFGYFAIEI